MASQRLTSLDAFRGLTIASMILVNNPGSWSFVYPPLRHAEWHGWTPTDLIFPFFLFIVGVSLTMSFARRVNEGQAGRTLYLKILKRSLLILGVGWFLHLFPRFRFATMRIPGVLPRIAVCFFFTAIIYLNTEEKGRIAASIACLAGYWLIMKLVPVPGVGAGDLTHDGNLCGYIDTKLMAGHLYQPNFDPEGLLSTIPAIATTLLGALAGDWLRTKRNVLAKTLGLWAGGALLATAGLALQPLFPINKQLWTPTFVLFTAGAAALLLGLCFIVADGMGFKSWATPFLVFGTNAIVAYAGSTLMVKIMALINITAGGETMRLPSYIYKNLLVPWAGEMNGSLAYAVFFVLIWMAIMIPLHKKKIFIRL